MASSSANATNDNTGHMETGDQRKTEESETRAQSKESTSKTWYWTRAAECLRDEGHPDLFGAFEQIQKLAPNSSETLAKQMLDDINKNKKSLMAKQWTIRWKDKTVNVRKHFDNILTGIRVFKDLGSAVASLDPVHAGIPWAGVSVILQVGRQAMLHSKHITNRRIGGTE